MEKSERNPPHASAFLLRYREPMEEPRIELDERHPPELSDARQRARAGTRTITEVRQEAADGDRCADFVRSIPRETRP